MYSWPIVDGMATTSSGSGGPGRPHLLDGGTSREAMECLSRVKERLYAARFGGGSVTPEQMSESVSELKGAGLL